MPLALGSILCLTPQMVSEVYCADLELIVLHYSCLEWMDTQGRVKVEPHRWLWDSCKCLQLAVRGAWSWLARRWLCAGPRWPLRNKQATGLDAWASRVNKQATGLDAWASRVKCPARFVSHLHEICIYIWVVYSLCFFCCLFITVTWWYVWCIEWASGNQEEVQACLVTLWLFIISCYSLYKTTLGLLCSWFENNPHFHKYSMDFQV